MDSGAAWSLCSEETARVVGLKLTHATKRFQGLGSEEAKVAEPVILRIGERSTCIQFHVCKTLKVPALIGMREMACLNVAVGTRSRQLYDETTKEVIAVAFEERLSFDEKMRLLEATNEDDGLSYERRVELGRQIFEDLTTLVKTEDKAVLWTILLKHQLCWAYPKPGQVSRSQVRFEVTGKPIKATVRRLAPPLKEELEKQVKTMLKAGVLVPSKSEWGSAPTFVRKKDGKWRLCLDYRAINRQMTPDAYPIPLLLENLQRAASHSYYVCLDLQAAFWNIQLAPESRKYTAIITHLGTYEFTVSPFGIRNSPAEFQRCMDEVFGDLYDSGVCIYVDDIVIFGDNKAKVVDLLDEILRRCCQEGFAVKLGKSEFLKDRISFLGHTIGVHGITSDPKKVQAIQEALPPKNKEELRAFLGTVGYLRRFVPHFAEVVLPLTELTKKGTAFEWTEDCALSFNWLKDELAATVLLSAPSGDGPFVIVSDASNYGLGNALLQLQGEELVLLEFGSKKLTPAERKWDTREKEAFGIKWSVEHYADYIKAGKTMVLTDHESLRWMDNSQNGRVQRLALYLQPFELQIFHLPGTVNMTADWLSRSL